MSGGSASQIQLVQRNFMSFKLKGWPEGHPHLTKFDGYPFGFSNVTSPNPLLDTNRDGYASSFKRLYRDYKRRAAKHGWQFSLTPSDFYLLTSQPCYFCAAPPSKKVAGKYNNPYIFNGVDRKDSAKGYSLGNCVGCCWTHNDFKGTLSFEKLYQHSLALVLSVSSRTALDIGDLECVELLIRLFPNVRFLKEHQSLILEDVRQKPQKHRWNWLLQPVQSKSQMALTRRK
jgi:hypothetical protein